ncbi:MAG: nitrilase-related carbon-nitrogen hydrolase [Gammaproteobacteria bacterium]|nr:nitrilase-related carbon-nitrogen hydrolase [Gammaproteobacteria bacterium]
MSKKKEPFETTRRELLAGAGAAGVIALAPGASQAGAHAGDKKIAAAQRGVYETVPLRQDAISVAAIQSRVRAVDIDNLKKTMRANLDHTLKLIDIAQGSPDAWNRERRWGGKQDLICMHEFPIQGFQPWTRTELNKVAFDLPGPESEEIGARAKEFDCYIAFGCYARDKDWPNHVINMSVIVGPTGEIVSKQWKARNILGLFGAGALIGTTVYNVLDRYVEMYGWDATLPVARTDIGNIAMTAVGIEPMIYQCLALKGTELLIMTVTGGSNAASATEAAKTNRIYTVGVGNSVSPDNIGFPDAAGAKDEGTVVIDPRGNTIGKTGNHHEDVAYARIPIADFRENRRFREVPAALIAPVLQAYQPAFQPNAFLENLPETYQEAGELVRQRMRGG